MEEEKTKTTFEDPFDESLEDEELILDEKLREEARRKVTLDGMSYSFTKPSYMLFNDQSKAKMKLKEAYTQNEILLLFGYSGCGKSTILSQAAQKNPDKVFYIPDFESLSPSGLIVRMGELAGIHLKMRKTEIERLKSHLFSRNKVMYLFDEVTATTEKSYEKLETIRRIHDATGVPVVLSGVTYVYKTIYAPENYNRYCSLITRLDEKEMTGMKREDAAAYIVKIGKEENVWFSYLAQEALIKIALNTKIGGINAFTTVIGRSITLARAYYYTSPGHTIPDKEKCMRRKDGGNVISPGDEIILTLPPTPETVNISERMVYDMQSEYKAVFPRQEKKKGDK